MSIPSRIALGLLVLLALGCELSPPPTQPGADPAAPTAPAGASQTPAMAPVDPVDPGPPPEPPWASAGGLAYREVALGGADLEAPLPMIVAIHGLGDGPDNFQHLYDGFTEPARLILPRGLDPVPAGGWSWFPVRARHPDVEALSAGVEGAAYRIADGLRALEQSRPTLGKPIVTGFSQGGILTFALAVQHPDVVGHAIAVAGWLPPPLLPSPQPTKGSAAPVEYPPLVALHGTADAAVLFEPTQLAVQTLVDRGIDAKLIQYEGVGHMIPELMRRDFYDRLADAVLEERRRPSP